MHCTSHRSLVTWAWKPHTLLPSNLRPAVKLDAGRSCCDIIWRYNCLVEVTTEGWSQWKLSRVLGTVEANEGLRWLGKARRSQLCWTSTEGRRALQRRDIRGEKKADSHIWHHHGGSLENQLSGKYNCADSTAKENYVMHMVMVIMG